MSNTLKNKFRGLITQSQIGKHFNLTQQAISLWFKEEVPAGAVLSLCSLVEWKVTPHEVRPDLYPNTNDGLPDEFIRKFTRKSD